MYKISLMRFNYTSGCIKNWRPTSTLIIQRENVPPASHSIVRLAQNFADHVQWRF